MLPTIYLSSRGTGISTLGPVSIIFLYYEVGLYIVQVSLLMTER